MRFRTTNLKTFDKIYRDALARFPWKMAYGHIGVKFC